MQSFIKKQKEETERETKKLRKMLDDIKKEKLLIEKGINSEKQTLKKQTLDKTEKEQKELIHENIVNVTMIRATNRLKNRISYKWLELSYPAERMKKKRMNKSYKYFPYVESDKKKRIASVIKKQIGEKEDEDISFME